MKKILALLLSALPATAAFAGFHVVDEPVAPTEKTEQAQLQDEEGGASDDASAPSAVKPDASGMNLLAVHFIGDPPTVIDVRRGFGRDVKLIEALKQIVPDGWHAFLSDEDSKFDKSKLVSWHGGRRWIDVLDILATEQSLSIDVDWTKQQIYVKTRKVVFSKILPGYITPAPQVWVAKAGNTLRDAVQAWGDKAGWTVRWVPDDLNYPIIGDLTFDGSFENAITGIFRIYEKAERPMHVDGNTQQKLVVVTENK